MLGLIVGEGVTGERDGLGDGAFVGLSKGDDEGYWEGSKYRRIVVSKYNIITLSLAH